MVFILLAISVYMCLSAPFFGGLFKGVFGGLSSLLTGPKSLGSPKKAPSQRKIDLEEVQQTAIRSDIIRRNQIRTSSLEGTGADFIAQMQEGVEDIDVPIPEIVNLSKDPRIIIGDERTELKDELLELQRDKTLGQTGIRGSATSNLRRTQVRARIGEIQGLLSQRRSDL
jgi:hypothetical protein